ncbi:hypothetical protein BHE74_00046675 [Ensete ventricosum]|nr:hypothetical protein BHE74_00046675 [Ensete ventricosum]RZS10845.1 hypothetical protein BHM03_00042114 [Ensete ventricosum]
MLLVGVLAIGAGWSTVFLGGPWGSSRKSCRTASWVTMELGAIPVRLGAPVAFLERSAAGVLIVVSTKGYGR